MFKGQHRAEYALFSVSAGLPLLSIKAERAATQIVRACKDSQAEIVLSLPAQLAVTAHRLAPGITADAFGVINRLLPGPGGIGEKKLPGKELLARVALNIDIPERPSGLAQ